MHNFISIKYGYLISSKSLRVELKREIAVGGKRKYEIAVCQTSALTAVSCIITL